MRLWKLFRQFSIFVLLVGVLSLNASAQGIGSALQPVFDMIFDITRLYQSQPYAVDFVLLLIFFMAFWKFAFSRVPHYNEQINSNAVKSMYVVLGIISAIGVTLLEIRSGVSLGALGPYFAFVFFIFLALLTYNFFGKSPLSLGLMLLILWSLITIVFGSWFTSINGQWWYQLLNSVSLFAGIILTVIGIMRIFGGQDPNPITGAPATPGAAPVTPPPAATPNPATVNDLANEIAQLGTDITVFQGQVNAFGPSVPPVGPAPRNLVNLAAQINTRGNALLGTIRSIQTSPQFRNLPRAQQAAFAAHVATFTTDFGNFAADYARLMSL